MLTHLLVFLFITSLVQNVVYKAKGTSPAVNEPFFFLTPAEPSLTPMTPPVAFGTAPHWEHDTQTLYYVNVFGKNLLRRSYGSLFKSKLDGMPSFIIPIEGEPNHFAVGMDQKVLEVEWLGEDNGAKVIRTIAVLATEHPDNRLSHGKADPRGRLFAGTMPNDPNSKKKQGSLYRFDADGAPHKLLADIGPARGLCWDRAHSAFYFIDNVGSSILRYDYDEETGDISNPKIVFEMQGHEYIVTDTESFRAVTQADLGSAERYVAALIEAGRQDDRQGYDGDGTQGGPDVKIESHEIDERGLLDYDQGGKDYDEHEGQKGRRSTVVKRKLSGVLDGMTIDTDGNLWVANYNGSRVLKIDPKKGKLLRVVSVATPLVTSATFGGPELGLLYVTSAATSAKGRKEQNSPAGATFSVSFAGAKGRPDNKVRFKRH